MNRIKFLCLRPGYRTGKYIYSKMASGFVTHEKCKEVTMEAQKEFKYSNDGEIFVAKKLNISIEKEAVSFVVPEGCSLNSPQD